MQNQRFDEVIPRRHTNSVKWDTPEHEGVIPMWVADMDFPTAPVIIEALRKRVEHGVFGYTKVPKEYYEAIDRWFTTRHGWSVDAKGIIYTTGVVPAISAILRGLTKPGDKVLVQCPAYNHFFTSLRNNGCGLSANHLIYHEDGSYDIDFEDFERCAADPQTKLMILCNPHNPAGRVWSREELQCIAEICKRHEVLVISDEIHCELTWPGHEYTPFALVAESLGMPYVVCFSPSKAFNIAGLGIANIYASTPELYAKIDRGINDNEVCDVNPFGVIALQAAYNEGGEWLESLKGYIYDNYLHALDFFLTRLPQYVVTPLEATYLMWINIKASGMKSEALAELLLEQGKVMLSPGAMYGPGGDDFLRLNIACPRATLDEGLARIESVLKGL